MGATLATKTRSRGRRTGGSYRPMADINVTPFVDVMLVLLIVFMVAAPMLSAGVDVDLPDANASQLQEADDTPIEVSLTKNGQVYIGETEIQLDDLANKLSAMTSGVYDRRIYIRGDQVLSYGQIMDVLGRINAAGYTKVALISESQ